MKFSIHLRILVSAFLILFLFLGLTGLVLDKAFSRNATSTQRENLRTQIYTLLATADLNSADKLVLPREITEPRLNVVDSTLHARVISPDEHLVWQSRSMLNISLPLPDGIKTGEFFFSDTSDSANTYTLLSFSTSWETTRGEKTYIFQIAENKENITRQIEKFRKNLWTWLAGIGVLLLIAQSLILHWSLRPLRRVADDVLEIERGTRPSLSGKYPRELLPLTNNLNRLLGSSQDQLTRYREALGNMAHSLKTPITVLHGIIESGDVKQNDTAIEQLDTINTIVEYQLQRASTAGRQSSNTTIHIKPVAEKILRSLDKVYRDKEVSLQVFITDELNYKIDEGDLYELLGNLLDNAFKWCNKTVRFTAKENGSRLELIIEDDGKGIIEADRERILLRGQRADQNISGHGLGMAMATDILLHYQGSMDLSDSSLGGSRITISI